MLYLRNLRVKLQEKSNRVRRTSYQSYRVELRFFLEFLQSNPYTKSLLVTLPEINYDDLCKSLPEQGLGGGYFEFTQSEAERAKFFYLILSDCIADSERPIRWAHRFSNERQLDAMLQDFNEAVLDPLVSYLHERIEDSGNLLYVLERFKMKVEWFRAQEYYELYEAGGEAALNLALRESLFDGGVEYPFSESVSPSGKTDVLSLDSEDPLVLEVKVFDGQSRHARDVSQGFHQLTRYAHDYNQSVGYLVVFNCSDKPLVLPSDQPSDQLEFPPRILHEGNTYFLLPIDIGPNRPSASKEKPVDRQVVTREMLFAAREEKAS